MKQKVVIRVFSMNSPKSRTRAMKIAVGIPGVISAEIGGDNKDQIVVTGDGVDATYLTKLLRKKVGFTELISVAAVEEKKEEKKKDENKDDKKGEQPMVWHPHQYGTPYIYFADVDNRHQDPCTIM